MDIRAVTRDLRLGVLVTLTGTTVLVGIMAPLQSRLGLLNVGLVLLLFTLVISGTWGWQVGLVAALSTNLGLNFFFVEPLHTFTVQRPQSILELVVFLLVSVVGGTLLSRARAAAAAARRRQAETAVLLDLTRKLIGQADPGDALKALCDTVVGTFQAPGASVLSGAGESWTVLAFAGESSAERVPDRSEGLMAQQALDSRKTAWLGNVGIGSTRPRVVSPERRRRQEDVRPAVALVPLRVGERPLGVLRLDGPIGDRVFREHPEQLLDAFAHEAALGVQRVELAQAAAHAEALRQADELKTALMTSISHDLKTPLATIKASVSSLLDRSVAWPEADVQSFLETIDSQSDRLDRVISDILDLSRIEGGGVTPVWRTLDARGLLEEAVERTRTATVGRAVRISAPESLSVATDESLILQALVNLIENAAKYSTEGDGIELGAERNAGVVELSVSDEGPGIAEEDLPHIFERFYRSSRRVPQAKGSGLGLAIVQAFVAVAGGTVRAESSAEGTRFVITLPAVAEARSA